MTSRTDSLDETRRRLIEAWAAIPENPPAEGVDLLVRRAGAIVHLIGWLDEHPAATRAEYQAELAAVRQSLGAAVGSASGQGTVVPYHR